MPTGWYVVDPPVTGTLAVQLKKAIDTIYGDNPVIGSIASELRGLEVAMFGDVPYVGSLSPELKKVVANLSAEQVISGTIATALKEVVVDFSGTVPLPVSGVLDTQLDKVADTFLGAQTQQGTIASQLRKIVSTLAGLQVQQGVIDSALKKTVDNLVGAQVFSGALGTSTKKVAAGLLGTTVVPVAFGAAHNGGYTATGSAYTQETTQNATVASDENRLYVGVLVTHSNWQSSYDTPPWVTDDLGETYTQVGSLLRLGVSGQFMGSISLFKCVNPQAGVHAITGHVIGTQWLTGIRIGMVTFKNVGSEGTPVATETAGSGTINVVVPSAVNNMSLLVAGFAASPTGFNQTQRLLQGSSVSGSGDYLLIGTAAGVAGNNTFTTSNSTHRGAIGVDLQVA